MSQDTVENFAKLVLKNLSNNGFPLKKVSLPVEKMYEVADNKGLNFNKVLDYLRENHQVVHETLGDKMVFSLQTPDSFQEDFGGMDSDMFAKAQEMMGQMDPAQLKEIQDKVMNMDPAERQALMEKAKSMFGKK